MEQQSGLDRLSLAEDENGAGDGGENQGGSGN